MSTLQLEGGLYIVATPIGNLKDITLRAIETLKKVALVSDSGTQLVSDLAFKLVKKLSESKYLITAIPGPCAATAALRISELPSDDFTFLGFLPKASSKRQKILETYGNLPATLVIYESPLRLLKLLK